MRIASFEPLLIRLLCVPKKEKKANHPENGRHRPTVAVGARCLPDDAIEVASYRYISVGTSTSIPGGTYLNKYVLTVLYKPLPWVGGRFFTTDTFRI